MNTAMKWLAAFILFGTWVALVILKMIPVDPLASFIAMTLGFLARHVVMDPPPAMVSPPPAAPPEVPLPNGQTRPNLYVPGQGGSFHPILGLIIAGMILGALTLITGCSTLTDQVTAQAKTLHDDEVQVWKEMACNTPVGALGRHPEIVGPIYSICFPGAVAAPPVPPASGAAK